jgi:alpha-D-ribose 1-methylphosphonate 5-triphosphate synthase subunit PhnG
MSDHIARKEWLGLLAKAPPKMLQPLWVQLDVSSDFEWLRRPEIGTIMVRGRMGGTGAPFNMGEMTVTRCSVRLPDGEVGHGYVQGRDKTHAKQSAIIDALMQTKQANVIENTVLKKLRNEARVRKSNIQSRADKTKVDFFTLVRGED